jgi:hypothetical protein
MKVTSDWERLYKNLFPMGIYFELIRIENVSKAKIVINIYSDIILEKFRKILNYMLEIYIYAIVITVIILGLLILFNELIIELI